MHAAVGPYDVTLVSPRNYFLYTPLLPSAATGTVEPRSIVDPVRSHIPDTVWTVYDLQFMSPANALCHVDHTLRNLSTPCSCICCQK